MAWRTEDILEMNTRKKQEEFYDSDFPFPGSFGLRVSSGGRKSFFLIFSQEGRRYRYTLGVFPLIALDEAKDMAEELLRKVQRGVNPAVELKAKRRSPLLSSLSRTYLEKPLGRPLSEATKKEYRRIFDRDILPHFGAKPALELNEDDADFLYANISKTRGSPVMAERSCFLLKSILKFAVLQGLIPRNPLRDWSPPESASERSNKPDRHRLPFADLLRLWVLLGEEDPLVAGPFRLMLLTGQRPAQVLQMKWSQIRGELWNIPARAGKEGSPSVPFFLTPATSQCLKTIQEQLKLRGLSDSPYLFPSKAGGHRRHLRKTALRLSQKLGLRRPFNPLSLRHTVRENLFDLGVRPDVIDRILYPQLPVRARRGLIEGAPYNYSEEIQQALLLWSKRLTTVTPLKPFPSGSSPRLGSKVISLFPGRTP